VVWLKTARHRTFEGQPCDSRKGAACGSSSRWTAARITVHRRPGRSSPRAAQTEGKPALEIYSLRTAGFSSNALEVSWSSPMSEVCAFGRLHRAKVHARLFIFSYTKAAAVPIVTHRCGHRRRAPRELTGGVLFVTWEPARRSGFTLDIAEARAAHGACPVAVERLSRDIQNCIQRSSGCALRVWGGLDAGTKRPAWHQATDRCPLLLYVKDAIPAVSTAA
jgi:hypothetical protein